MKTFLGQPTDIDKPSALVIGDMTFMGKQAVLVAGLLDALYETEKSRRKLENKVKQFFDIK